MIDSYDWLLDGVDDVDWGVAAEEEEDIIRCEADIATGSGVCLRRVKSLDGPCPNEKNHL